jgi:hypothetical protein
MKTAGESFRAKKCTDVGAHGPQATLIWEAIQPPSLSIEPKPRLTTIASM